MEKTKLKLTAPEVERLAQFISSGKALARHIKHANVILKLHEGWTQCQIAAAFDLTQRTVVRLKQRCEQEGVEAVLVDKPRSGAPKRFGGETAVAVTTLACTDAPEGHSRWTLQMLAAKIVQLELAESISANTVRRLLKKNELKPWQVRQWCIPTVSAEFVAAMEEVLTEYAREYDPKRPVVCLDEKVKYLLSSPTPNLPIRAGSSAKEDYEYKREGTCNLFVMVEPKAGKRHVLVTERRTAREYAYAIKWLVDIGYGDAEKISLIDDNLNTHCGASLYKTFAPAEARRILAKIEYHHTPKHGSWLNRAEIEIGVFARQCWKGRISDKETLVTQVAALEQERNKAEAKINWQFTCDKARVTFHRFYSKLTELP